jgi:hypothetical protein
MTPPGYSISHMIFANTIDIQPREKLWTIVNALSSCGGLVWKDDRKNTKLVLAYTATVLVSSYLRVKSNDGEGVMETLVNDLGMAARAVNTQDDIPYIMSNADLTFSDTVMSSSSSSSSSDPMKLSTLFSSS